MQTIYLDISNKGVYPCIHAKQGEVGRKFRAVITDGGVPYNIPETALLSVWYSGNTDEGNYSSIGEKSAFSISGNKVDVELVAQMLLKPGHGELCLSVTNANGTETNTWNIPYEVEYKPGAGSSVPTQYYTALTEAATNAAKSATDAERFATNAATYASLPTRPFSLNNVVCIGDSFLDGNSGELNGWGMHLENMAKSINPGAVFRYGHCEGGAGFVVSGNGGNTFADLISEQASEMTEEERGDVETVIVVGGINDVSAGSAVDYSYFVEAAKESFKNAKIVLAMNPVCVTLDTEFFQPLLKPSTDPDVCVLTDAYYWIIAEADLQSGDFTHPSQNGYGRIATHLFYASKGLNTPVGHKYKNMYTGDFGYLYVEYIKSGANITFKIVGEIQPENSGEINTGAFVPWVNQHRQTVLPVWSNVLGAYIAFYGSELKLFMQPFEGTATVNCAVSVSIDAL